MTSLSKELVYIVLQFLDEENFKESVHKLEQESGFWFDLKHLEEKVVSGEWEEAEKYLSGFTKLDDNRYSMKIFFEIRKQKYLEALDRNDKTRAIEILVKDLKVFSTFNEDLYKELTQLLTLDNFRDNEQLSRYGDTRSARNIMLLELRKLIEANPLFRDKLVFPALKASRLRTMINHSLNWQHQLCKNPKPNPDIRTLLNDHTCSPSNGACTQTPPSTAAFSVGAISRLSSYAPLGASGGLFPPAPAVGNANTLAGWMMNANPAPSGQSSVISASTLPTLPTQVSMLKHPRTPSNVPGMMDYQNSDHEQQVKRWRSAQSVDESLQNTYAVAPQQASWSLDDLPKTVVCTLHQGSAVTSMDFHPSLHGLLAVGCGNGEISLWVVGLRERLTSKPFKVLNIAACSVFFQAAYAKDSSIAVSRVSWSPDGNFIGVAFTKHLIHLYAYQSPNDLHQLVEVDAHVGSVNDLAFSYLNRQLAMVTCGDDKMIKVWDLSGRKLLNFEGHAAPVYSVCPHSKDNIQFIFSTAVDGKIKAWLYDNFGPRMDYDAPGQWCTAILYSGDGTRLFSCGTGKDGDPFLVEWNENEGAVKRTYSGFTTKSAGVVQFDTSKNRFLAAGEDSEIKFWDMDNVNVLASTNADGGLPNLPRLRYNKVGNLLAVSTADNGLKVLANADGINYLRTTETRSFEASKAPLERKAYDSSVAANIGQLIAKVEPVDRSSPAQTSQTTTVVNGDDSNPGSINMKRSMDSVSEKPKAWKLTEIVDPIQCLTATLPDNMGPNNKVSCLLYTKSGTGLLALGSKGIQKLWKWSRSELNPSGKAMASVLPQLWQPTAGLVMANEVPENSEAAIPCIALSKNDAYTISACGGKVSLFNLVTFKEMASFMEAPPRSTSLAFDPKDNNIIAVGMEDSSIHIYNVRVDKDIIILNGHEKAVTGLAFSTQLGILVSSSADAELSFWCTESWNKKNSLSIKAPDGTALAGVIRVQFNIDQVHFLVYHELQLAIYDALKMELVHQWIPQDGISGSISSATYSCNNKLIYAAFTDGNIGVLEADSLKLKYRIATSAYLHQASSDSQNLYPVVIAAHPKEPNQFSVGMSDGTIKVIEPTEFDGTAWQNGRTASPSVTANTSAPPPEQ